MTETINNQELKSLFESSQIINLILGDKHIGLEIIEVKDIQSSIPEQIAFSLLLKANSEQLWEQGLFELQLGDKTLVVFMVPISQNEQSVIYEVVFN